MAYSSRWLIVVFLLFAGLFASPGAAAVPVASFSASPTTGIAPLAVSFTDGSSGSPAGWAWYFGDETYSAANWTRQSDAVPWTPRSYPASVALPDGSIVMTGGYSGGPLHDVWRSTDKGATWTKQTDAAAWPARSRHAAVCLPDGSIVVMGGRDSTNAGLNDVWRSTDKGATWTQQADHAQWPGRDSHAAVALPDGSIVLMGGNTGSDRNDVWRSTDRGATWTQQTAGAAWGPRYGLSAVVLADGRIAMTGGFHYDPTLPRTYGDLWISADQGVTWTEQDLGNYSGLFYGRRYHGSAALPDGSILIMGGSGPGRIMTWGWWNDVIRLVEHNASWSVQQTYTLHQRRAHSCVALRDGSVAVFGGEVNPDNNWGQQDDAWLLETASSTARNPVHAYAQAGTYDTALRVYNADGSAGLRRTAYITVAAVLAIPPGTLLPTDTNGDGLYDDVNGNGRKDFADVVLYFNQMTWIAGNEPVAAFDCNRNGRVDFSDVVWLFNNL
ncbi:MAG: kelch repeat-containing protein [Methanospirillum sp.]